jgi:hypothetical protein
MKICHAVVLWIGVAVIAGSLGQRDRDWTDDLINTTNARLREAIERSLKNPLYADPPVFDEATGAFKIPPPPGFTAEEWDAEFTRVVREDMQREGSRLPGEPTVNEQIKALRRSRLSPAQLEDLAYFANPESIPSEASVRDGALKDDPGSAFNIVILLAWVNNAGWALYAIWLWVQRWRGAGSK